jgi:uncharacterized protein YbjT (DUF2867 family)
MLVVAGVTGHVGSVAARELLSKGQKIKVIVRDPAKGVEWSKKGAEVAVGSLDDAGFLTGALKGAKGFFTLLPPGIQVTRFIAYQRRTADAIAAAIRNSGVPYVVLLSSVGADLAEGTGALKGLHYFENVVRATGVRLVAIRPGYFQENIASALAPARTAGIVPNVTHYSADDPFQMIATHDIGLLAAHELLFQSGKSEAVDLQGPSYSIRQAAGLLGAALGKTLRVMDVPPEAQVAAFKQAGMSQELAELMPEMYAGFASGLIRPVGDRLKLGFTPLETVIRTLV